jgi:hypothetical protein
MQRSGKITASLAETKKYLILFVHQLFTMYDNNHKTYVCVEADSGYREALMTYLLSSTKNIIKIVFEELKALLFIKYGAKLSYALCHKRIYFSIEPIENTV